MRFKEAIQRFVAYVEPRWGLAFRESNKKLFRDWEALWGPREVADIKPLDVESRYLSRLKLGLSGGRLNFERLLLQRFFRWAKTHELCTGNPVSTWPTHPTTAKEPRLIPEGMEYDLIAQLPPWMQRCAWVSLYTLIRQGTARKLTWADVVEGLDGSRALVIPSGKNKTRKALRIPLCPEADRWLGPRPERGGALFPELRGKSLIWHHMKRAGRILGLDPLPGWHDLRKVGATRLIKRGVPVPVVMKLGGWSAMPVLLQHYVGAVTEQEGREALAKIGGGA